MKTVARSLHREVLFFTFLACGLVLAAVGGLLSFHHLGQMGSRLAESVQSTARIVADNGAAALGFRDEIAAADMLASLRYDPLVVSAAFYDRDGRLFVSYGIDLPVMLTSPAEAPDKAVIVDVVYRGERLGRLMVVSDIRAVLWKTAATWAVVFFAALVLAGGLALWVARRFQRVVAEPLVALSRTAEDVTRRGDYSLRAEPRGSPEVMSLARAFNAMLGELGRRGDALDRQVESLNAEIRQRLTAEENLRQNTREMLRMSHRAGVAEVATGVLHNIGNALNSINVSAELLADTLKLRARDAVERLRAFFVNPPAKAVAIYGAHPDGESLRRAAAGNAEHAIKELEGAHAELECLRTGVAHLKDIVAGQQALARAERHVARVDLVAALDQALIMDRTADRGGVAGLKVEVEQAQASLPMVLTDQVAIEQILINLLANARESIAEAAPKDPEIRVTVGPASATHLSITIRDNGVGIDPERLLSIFTYGYTTKRGGHGFGLHNAANLARLLGGSLRVHSDGVGKGAAFTLEVLLCTAASTP